ASSTGYNFSEKKAGSVAPLSPRAASTSTTSGHRNIISGPLVDGPKRRKSQAAFRDSLPPRPGSPGYRSGIDIAAADARLKSLTPGPQPACKKDPVSPGSVAPRNPGPPYHPARCSTTGSTAPAVESLRAPSARPA